MMSTIPAPPPMPPAPSPIAEHKTTGQVSVFWQNCHLQDCHLQLQHGHYDCQEVPKLPPPIWLEEIQNNAIFNKQRHKLLLEKQSLVEKEVKLLRKLQSSLH